MNPSVAAAAAHCRNPIIQDYFSCFFRILFSFLTALALGLSFGGREAGETAAAEEEAIPVVLLVVDETLVLVVVLAGLLLLLMTLGFVTMTLSLDCC